MEESQIQLSSPLNEFNYETFQRVSHRRMEVHEENNKKLSPLIKMQVNKEKTLIDDHSKNYG